MVAVPLAWAAPVLLTEMLSPEYVALMESPLLNVMVRVPAIVPVLPVSGVMVPEVLKLAFPNGDMVPVPESE
jgi:hypothetical protein